MNTENTAAASGGVPDDLARDVGWFSELLDNVVAVVGDLVPWWAWALVITGVTLALILRAQAGRTVLARFATGYPLDGVPRTNARMWSSATKVLDDFADTRPSQWHHKPYAVRALVRWGVVVWLAALVGGWTASAWVVFGGAVVAPLVWALVRFRRQVGQGARWVAEHVPRPRPAAVGAAGDALALEAAPGTELAPVGPGGALAVPGGAASGGADEDEADEAMRPRDLEAEILFPLWDGVRKALDLSERAKPKKYITLPADIDADGAEVAIHLPRAWQGHPEEKRLLDHAVQTRLPGEFKPSYSFTGARHTATYKRVPRPPKKVTFDEVRDLVMGAPAHAPVFGIGPERKTIDFDLKDDSPHIALSMGSGAGKSVLGRSLLVPMLFHGAEAHIMDIKRTSHRWARGMRNVRTYKEVHEIHDALVWLGEVADDRHRAEDDNPDVEFHRIVIVVEEMNMLADALEDFWEECKANNKDLPKKSPAFKGLAKISYGGRSARVHLICVAQKLDARLFGSRSGGAVRENFATRVLGRYTDRNWKQLTDVKPMPKSSRIVGRVQVVIAGVAYETQVIFYPEDTAREVALSGTVTDATVPPSDAVVVETPTSDVSHGDVSQDEAWDMPTTRPGALEGGRVVEFRRPLSSSPWTAEEVHEEITLVTFKEAHEKGLFDPSSYDAARKTYARDHKAGKAPGPVQENPKKWDADALADWWADRQSKTG